MYPLGGSIAIAGVISEELIIGARVNEGLTLILPTSALNFEIDNPNTPGQSEDVLPSNPELADGFGLKLGAQIDVSKKVVLYVKAETDSVSTADAAKVINIGNLKISPHPTDASNPGMRIYSHTPVPGPSSCEYFDGVPGGDSPLYGLRIYEQSGPGSSEPVYQFAIVNSWNYQPGYYTANLTFTLVVE